MPDVDPYHAPAALIARADEIAGQHALDDPLGPWGQIQAFICLARLPLDAPLEPATADESCAALLQAALTAVDNVPPGQQRPSHSLDRVYVATALAKVQELTA